MSLASNKFLKTTKADKREKEIRIATITGVNKTEDSTNANVKFYGDDESSNITYPVLYSGEPVEGDKVVMQKVNNSWVIVGKTRPSEGGGGGGGGTTNYNDLSNKPKINGNVLIGDINSDTLGINILTVSNGLICCKWEE